MRILGKGKTAQAIYKKYPEAKMFDDNDKDIYDINSDELTVVSPGIPPHNFLVKHTKNLISEYDLFKNDMPYSIWISGTNGKTTTTQMLQHLLKDKSSVVGGNIGTPLATLNSDAKIWILETSSFTLHYTNKTKPNIYILLPISEDHLSWHGDFNEYEKAKLKPLNLMSKDDVAIIPAKYKDYQTNANKIIYNSVDDLSDYFKIDKNKINFKEPFLIDALLAMAVDKLLFNRIDYQKINSFIQDKHKLEEFRDKFDRVWVDDSKATNIDATLQALKSYSDKKIYLILGGDDKGVDLNKLFNKLIKYDIEIFGIGKNVEKIEKLSIKYNIKYSIVKTIDNAILKISEKLTLDSIALLSPAAASLDQFNSYKHRGEEFKKYVKLL